MSTPIAANAAADEGGGGNMFGTDFPGFFFLASCPFFPFFPFFPSFPSCSTTVFDFLSGFDADLEDGTFVIPGGFEGCELLITVTLR